MDQYFPKACKKHLRVKNLASIAASKGLLQGIGNGRPGKRTCWRNIGRHRMSVDLLANPFVHFEVVCVILGIGALSSTSREVMLVHDSSYLQKQGRTVDEWRYEELRI